MGNLTETQSQSASPTTPAGYGKYFKQLSGQGLFSPYTSQGASGLNSILGNTQTGLGGLGQLVGAEGAGLKGLNSYIGTPGQPSAATQAGLKEFSDLQAPEILQQSTLMGQGNSGAALQALTQGQESALVPLLQSDQANSLAASGQLAQLGAGASSSLFEGGLNAANILAQLGISRESEIGQLISQFIGQNQSGKVNSQQPLL